MEAHNSQTDFYVGLITACHRDVTSTASNIVHRIESKRDLDRIVRRTRLEGLSFLTKTLPAMGKAIDKALSSGGQLQWPFTKKRKSTQIPVFLGSLLSQVFDSEGYERSDASVTVLDGLRQLLYLFYSLELPYKDETVAKSVSTFVEVDQQCSLEIESLGSTQVKILNIARNLVRYVTMDLNLTDICCGHGPGSVSTGQREWEKPHFNRVVEKLDKKYPYMEYFCFNYSHVSDELETILNLPRVDSGRAKLIPVPKDSRGPRLISTEPLENQWIQQGQHRAIVDCLEKHRYTRGHLNFRDQTINGSLALEGSYTGQWATLDMKEASDRVSVDLVKYLVHEHHYEYYDASRSTHTLLPDGTLHELKKFAPMGSALCFPVEALCFWALTVSSIIVEHSLELQEALKLVYVYGDDIICRTDHHGSVMEQLPHFGLLLNVGKCCVAGSFRESCGVDAYKGVDVTPVKCRSTWSSSLSPECLASYAAYSNGLYAKRFIYAAEYIEFALQRWCKIPYAQSDRFGGVCFRRPGHDTRKLNAARGLKTRFNSKLFRLEVRAPVLEPLKVERHNDSWSTLLYRWFKEKVPFGNLFVPKMYEDVTSMADQFELMNSRVYDATVARDTVNMTVDPPTTRALPGEYTVRHRNRLQWRWTVEDN